MSREGLKLYSVTLDTLGCYARSLDDLGLFCDVFDVHDDAPPRPVTLKGARIAVCRTLDWPSATPGTPEANRARDAGGCA